MPKLLLVDGSNYLFRAFHALPPLTTSKGEPTGAIKGFNGMLRTVHDTVSPDCEICVFDAKGKNFRHELFESYKANRPPMPEELRSQIEPIFELVRLQGWPLLQVEGVEADDVLGTLAVQAVAVGWDVVIATGDKDLAQLVSDRIHLINTMTKTVLDREGVFEKYGVYPERVIDYLALMGDKVDNVPGINKCGPKTAAKWIAEYGSLDNLVANADQVKGKIGEYLREGIPFLDLAKKLVTINTQAPVSFDPIEFTKKEPDAQGLAQFYARWEMSGSTGRRAVRTPKKTVPTVTPDLFAAPSIPTEETAESTPAVTPVVAGDVRVVCSPDEVAQLADELNAVATDRFPVAVWVAGNNTSLMHDAAVGLAFALNPLRTAYVPLMHQDGPNADAEAVREHLAPWFASAAAKVFFDAKRCQHLLANARLPVSGTVHDVMLMSYVIEAHLKHNFAKIVARTTGLSALDDEGLYGKGAGKLDAVTVPLKDAAAFGVRTAALLRTAASVMWVKLSEDEALLSIYRDMELPVMQVLTGMERSGVLIDREKLAQQSKELAERIDEVKAKIEEIAGGAFNPASPKQLAQVLFEKLQLPVKKKTASGTPSTDEEVLSELALDYPLPKLILEFRALSKLKSTYTDKLPQMADPEDGRVHTTFGQATAVTGRLASSDPNLQNIPVRTPIGRELRECFIAEPGCKLIAADYSQVELRLLATIADVKFLQEAFREGVDIHRKTAAQVFGIPYDEVDAGHRRRAKAINFGIVYGISAFGLSKEIETTPAEAQRYIDAYFANMPEVKAYMDATINFARQNGYVVTPFNRKITIFGIQDNNKRLASFAERAAINAPIQGGAADIIKLAMNKIAASLAETGLKTRMLLQVHDELVFEAPLDEVETAAALIKREMENITGIDLKVPLIADVGIGDNWGKAH